MTQELANPPDLSDPEILIGVKSGETNIDFHCVHCLLDLSHFQGDGKRRAGCLRPVVP